MAEMKPMDAVFLQQMFEKIGAVDLEAVQERIELSKTALDRALDDVKLGGKMKRILAKKAKPGRPRLHHKTRAARKKVRKADWWLHREKPRRQARLALELRTAEGWYKYLMESWRKQKIKGNMSEEDWSGTLWPLLEGKLPVFRRRDTSKGMTLDNVTMYESGTRNVLFCPDEYKLKLLGYAL